MRRDPRRPAPDAVERIQLRIRSVVPRQRGERVLGQRRPCDHRGDCSQTGCHEPACAGWNNLENRAQAVNV